MKNPGYYVGIGRNRLVFHTENEPTRRTHGHLYRYCIGPFQSEEAAEYMKGPGFLQPWCITPNDCEKLIGGHVPSGSEEYYDEATAAE